MDRDDVLDAIEDAIEDGSVEDALTLCDLLLARDPADPDALVLRGEVLADCGDFTSALAHYERAHVLVPDWEDAEVMRAGVLLELGRVEEATELLVVALARDPNHAPAQQARAIACELAGDEVGAQRHYRQAARLDPALHLPFRVSEEVFMELARKTLASFPPAVSGVLDNVEIHIEDLPRPTDAGDPGTPLSMLVLGYFDGTPRSVRSLEDPLSDMPSHVFLFKKNHERICRNLAELREQVDITLKHELGHYLGLDEDDMDRLGLH